MRVFGSSRMSRSVNALFPMRRSSSMRWSGVIERIGASSATGCGAGAAGRLTTGGALGVAGVVTGWLIVTVDAVGAAGLGPHTSTNDRTNLGFRDTTSIAVTIADDAGE